MDIHKGMKRLKLQLSKDIYDLLFKRKVISKTNNPYVELITYVKVKSTTTIQRSKRK